MGEITGVSALRAALAAEDAAIYGYGVAGAHLSGGRQAAAEQYWERHNKARDTLTAMIYALGAQPVTAQAFYSLPFPVHDRTSAMALAAYLEDGVTRAYLGIVAVSGCVTSARWPCRARPSAPRTGAAAPRPSLA
jgi:hypothetical protein